MRRNSILLLAAATNAFAQRPHSVSVCDYYSHALFKDNGGETQQKLLVYIVNTAVVGTYNNSHVINALGVEVPGILAPGDFNGTKVNLLPYFNGGFKSTNRGGSAGVAVTFLDGGGTKPLMNNKPGENEDSAQYKLLSHLYSYFGILLGCSNVGTDGFPAHGGERSQTKVHKYVFGTPPTVSVLTGGGLTASLRFMNLSPHQIGYFITQVGLSAASFGVSERDVNSIATALGKAFAVNCLPPTVIDRSQGAQLQSICLADNCPRDPQGDCAPYEGSAGEPEVANATLAMGEGKNGTSVHGTSKSAGPKPTKAPGSSMGNAVAVVQASVTLIVGLTTLFAFAV